MEQVLAWKTVGLIYAQLHHSVYTFHCVHEGDERTQTVFSHYLYVLEDCVPANLISIWRRNPILQNFIYMLLDTMCTFRCHILQ